MTFRFDKEFGSTAPSRHPAAVVEAARWLVMLSDPECTDEERQEFVAWLRRSNLHVEEFLRISELTQGLTEFAAWPKDSVAEVIARARSAPFDAVTRITPPSDRGSDPSHIRSRDKPRLRLALAASLVVGFLFLQRYWQGGLTFGSVKA